MTEYKTDENRLTYKGLARHYDALMGGNKYPGWKELIASVVKQYGIQKDVCLDVACGTGNISQLVKELGFGVAGVDMSREMIDIAQKKFPEGTFVCSDVRDFSLNSELQSHITLAVSFYDSLNYLLTDDDMMRALTAVYENIPTGAIFLFDMNTTDHVKAAQRYKPRVFRDTDFYTVFRFSGEERFWILDMDIFSKEGDLYRLTTEHHIERAYDREHILPLIEQAGFKLLEVKNEYKLYEDGANRLSRLYFIVQKP